MSVRKIEARKLAEELLGGRVVGECGFFRGAEAPKVHRDIINADFGEPGALVTPDSLKARPAFASGRPIYGVLRSVAKAQIGAPIVESVPVNVIDRDAIGRIDQESMQINRVLPRIDGPGCGHIARITDNGTPLESAGALVIGVID